MTKPYSLRVFADQKTEQALKYMSYKTNKSIAEIVRDALEAYPPLTKAYEDSQKFQSE